MAPVHINKTSSLLKEKYGIDEPIIAYAYVKFDPIPPEWEHLLADGNHLDQGEFAPAKRGCSGVQDKKLELLAKAVEVASGLMELRSGANVRSKMISKEGSLENMLLFVGYVALFLKPEIKQLLKEVYKDRKATSTQVRAVVKEMFEQVYSWNKLVKQASKMIHTATTEIMGKEIESGKYNITAEARLGVLGNLEKFQDSFSAAKNGRDMKVRIKSLKRALKQLESIAENLTEADDKEIIHMYLSIRTRDTNLFLEDENYADYDNVMQQICDIRDSLNEDSF